MIHRCPPLCHKISQFSLRILIIVLSFTRLKQKWGINCKLLVAITGTLTFLCSNTIFYAQDQLTGVLFNRKAEKVEGAQVILKRAGSILDYTITNNAGIFSLAISGSYDSLALQITHLSYNKKQIMLDRDKSHYEIVLDDRSYDLPEVQVNVPPVQRLGDTLIFNLASYLQEGDENLEEVLGRLPGIAVSSDGTIFYNGLNINKFYIEGLDLLEGRYRIVTRNLGLHHIRDVEIIERHQPIRALDSIYRPPNAAINLKLKSDVALTGSGEAELAMPSSGLLATNIFGFSKQYQFNVSSSFNNLGDHRTAQYSNLYSLTTIFESPLVELRQPFVPQLHHNKATTWFNRELGGSVNYLRRLGKYTQLKLQSSALSDHISRIGHTLTQYFAGEMNSEFNQGLQHIEKPLEVTGRAIFEYNAAKMYTRVETKLDITRDQSLADNIINAQSTLEALEKNVLEVSNQIDVTSSKHKKAYAVTAEVLYQEIEYDLDVQNAFLLIPSFGERYYSQLNQVANTKTLDLNLHTNFYYNNSQITGQVEVRPAISSRSIGSVASSNLEPIESNFYNDHRTDRLSFLLDQTWRYDLGRSSLSLKLPFSVSRYTVINVPSDVRWSQSYSNYRPTLRFSLETNHENTLSIFSGYFQDVFTYGDLFYDGFIVQSNRRVTSQAQKPNAYYGYLGGISLVGKNQEISSFYLANIIYRKEISEQIRSNVFDDAGIIDSYQDLENKSTSLNINGYFEFSPRGIFGGNFKGDVSIRENEQVINSMFARFRTYRFLLEPEISFSIGSNATVLSTQWTKTWFRMIEQQNSQFRFRISHYWQITPRWGFDFAHSSYHYGSMDISNWSHLMNLEWKYNLSKNRGDIHLRIVNLLNTETFMSYYQNAYYDTLHSFRLRPRQWQGGIKINL